MRFDNGVAMTPGSVRKTNLEALDSSAHERGLAADDPAALDCVATPVVTFAVLRGGGTDDPEAALGGGAGAAGTLPASPSCLPF